MIKFHTEVDGMKKNIKNIVFIVLGNVLIAFGLSTLVLENNIIAGGVSGIGVVLNHYLGLSVSLSVGIINVILFVLGLVFLGKVFAMSTLISTFLFPIMLGFFEATPAFHHYLNDPLLACILAGGFVGIGIGLILQSNGSTGGVDILAILINKKTGAPVHIVLNCIDLMVLLFQMTFNDTTHVIYGIVTVMVTSVMLNKTLTRGKSLVQISVMSDAYQEIKDMILHQYDAGVTLLASEKGYTNQNSKLVLSIIPYRKLPSIKQKIHEIDSHAFVIVAQVDEVGGCGFTFEKRNEI